MCGIVGCQGSFSPDLLRAMSECVSHRGPDDAGEWFDLSSEVGLAHRRLSILDTSSAGHQPMSYAGYHLVYNGEIYNFRELRAGLEQKGHQFLSQSDSEVLLHGWAEEGKELLNRLNGIFAFAVWDAHEQVLTVVRDPVGVKPLYYTESLGAFYFASELKALLRVPRLDRTIDLQAVDAYLTYLWAPAPLTMFRSVRKLRPGEALQVRGGRVVRRWSYAPLPISLEHSSVSPREAAMQLRKQLDVAVSRQLVSDVPVGAFLSGGLDSSAVVVYARKHVQKLPCFSIGFGARSMEDEGFADDLRYARRVADWLDVELHELRVDSEELSQGIEEMVWKLDEPQADPAPLLAEQICAAARARGIKVLLSGAGGDDLFTGYRRHRALVLERWWSWLPRPMRLLAQQLAGSLPQLARWLPDLGGLQARGVVFGRRVERALRFAGGDAEQRLVGYFHWLGRTRQQQLYTAEMSAALQNEPALLAESLRALPQGLSPLQQMLFLEIRHFLADHNLNYTDKMGMAHGVEVRVPLLDLELIQFASRLPDSYKQRGSVGKWIFKKAMESMLPKDVIYRPKTGFGVPLRHWLHHAFRPLVEELLSERSIRHRGWFRPEAVQRLLQEDASGRLDATYPIFALLCMELWCRRFVDIGDTKQDL